MYSDFLSAVFAGLTIAAGLLLYWYLKWRARSQLGGDTLDTFFLAGGRVGSTLTAHNNWGLGFAFANAIWYFAYLGYHYGPWAFLLQLPWVASIIGVGLLAGRYIKASANGTVHGFIGARHGTKAALLAASATLIGYFLNCGFEMFFASHLLAAAFGIQEIEYIIAIASAVFVAGYCMAGGYYASVVTDRYQNLLGAAALIVLLLLVLPTLAVQTGSLFPFSTGVTFETPAWHFVLGIAVFAGFFNFVDMANWQALAANRRLPESAVPSIRWGLIRSALTQMLIPAFVGTWFGVALRVIKSGVDDDQLFNLAFNSAFPVINTANAVLLGLIVFGLFSLTLSAAGSYAVAFMQTLTMDVVKRDDIDRYFDDNTADDERVQLESDILAWVRRWLLVITVLMVLVFGGLYYLLAFVDSQAVVFQFQFVMYGAAVTLLPSVVSELRRPGAPRRGPSEVRTAGLMSIAIGLCFVIIPFIFAAFLWQPLGLNADVGGVTADAVINLTPLTGLIAATAVYLLFSRGKA